MFPEDRKMGPLIKKNLESHALKNMKANLMYAVTICFLVFSGANFISIGRYLSQMSHIMFGADIAVKSVQPGGRTMVDEHKIRQVMDPLLEVNGGDAAAYTFSAIPVH